MKTTASILGVAASLLVSKSSASVCKPLVQDKPLIDSIQLADLMSCSQDLQDLAYSTELRNRVVGTDGHKKTVEYIAETLESLGDYYTLEYQDVFTPATISSSSSLTIGGQTIEAGGLEFSNNGTWANLPVVPVAALGCEAANYPNLTGSVALIARGTCPFAEKGRLAGEAGAVAAIIYNNAEIGKTGGTLGGPNDLITVAGISRPDGLRLVEAISNGQTVRTSGVFSSYVTDTISRNVIATSKYGDPDNVLFLGAHSDSVAEGPGINDNGSGTCGLLTVAKALSHWRTNNQVKFAWWAAEEEGLVGAQTFVNVTAKEQLDKIRLYLNFDMIASPNYVLSIYDGDGSAFNISGPAGSAESEKLFEDYYTANDIPFVSSEFSGRSDYGPFLEAGIPCGGLDTGADGVKTEEEVALFGGVAGQWHDPNYHSAKDTIDNIATKAYIINGKAIAHAVATYARSWAGFPAREPVAITPRADHHAEAHHGHSLPL
ncbi:aminopeptidase Y [Microdochium nivale]|nr:aminopeptidase Y [Microdochium nivale]